MRKAFTENLHIKGMALLVAVLLHLFVRGDEEDVTAVWVDVVSTVPADKVLLEEPVDRIKVTVRGRSSVVSELEVEPLRVNLGQVEGEQFEFTPDILGLPTSVSVISISPPSMPVKLDETGTKEVQILPRIVGDVASGHRVVAQHLSHATVTAKGPRTVLKSLSEVLTEAIDITGRSNTFRTTVAIRPRSGIEFQPANVGLEIVIEPVKGTRTINDVSVIVRNTRFNADLQPDVVDVVLEGAPSDLEGIAESEVVAYVDAREEDDKVPGTYRKRVELDNVPTGVNVVRISPVTVKLTTREPSPPPEE